MSIPRNRFQVFFKAPAYTDLKNLIYNYRLRKRSVARHLSVALGKTLEIGSGISPMVSDRRSVVYTDLSFSALDRLRQTNPQGWHVAADATRLPFKAEVFRGAVCSEVLEHIEDDLRCIVELKRVLAVAGRLVVTFPHRRCYFAIDDRYVSHRRRYELKEMKQKLEAFGFEIQQVEKVLGPLEKLTMMLLIAGITMVQGRKVRRLRDTGRRLVPGCLRWVFDLSNRFYAGLVWLDAKTMPLSAATVLLIVARRA